ncbi:cell division protein FtsA [Neisseria meningitidis]|uniref:cell division protein FtsA n=1 Tax=Neisseria meningitidis TaxID=487 RepID=UPI000FEE4B02|nr:cell division protein FtsA [Neisseria meningitidis]RPC12732.1 cell division protein FtsA [Neisseria meningitidis]
MEQQQRYISVLDIGTSKVLALIGEVQDDDKINIVGLGQAPSRGLRAGMVTNIDATVQAIRQAVNDAELMADTKITHVTTGIAGNHIRSLNSQGVVKIKDGEVTQADIDRAIETAKAINIPPDQKILDAVVQDYIIDTQLGVREPIGMSGVRLDTRVHIITGASTAVQNVQKCIERCGLKSDQIMLQPLASGQAVLTEDEKDLGVCVIDIGGGTTDIAVYMNGAIRHTSVIPAGGNLITKDLSKSLRTPLDAAEYIKIHYGVASCDTEGLGEMIEVPGVGDRTSRQVSSKVLAAIISARIQEIFGVVLGELQKSGFPKEVLNAGIVLTGGVSMMTGIVEFAEKIFDLPVRTSAPQEMGGLSDRVRTPRFSTAIGLLHAACKLEGNLPQPENGAVQEREGGGGLLARLKRWIENSF